MLPGEIQALTIQEAVRKRPTMYMGPLDRIHYAILEEMLCMSREDAQCSDDICLDITLYSGCRAKVEFTGALPVEERNGRPSILEVFLTSLAGCKAAKAHGDRFDFCKGSAASANALCRDLTAIVITKDNQRYFQYYSCGLPTSKMEHSRLSPEANPNTTILNFQVDFDLFPGREFDYEVVVDWCRTNLDNIEAVIRNARTGQSTQISRIKKLSNGTSQQNSD
jgi:DNA gyrase/topoisomerase IV subunit B